MFMLMLPLLGLLLVTSAQFKQKLITGETENTIDKLLGADQHTLDPIFQKLKMSK